MMGSSIAMAAQVWTCDCTIADTTTNHRMQTQLTIQLTDGASILAVMSAGE